MMGEIDALIARAEKATGPDVALGHDIWALLVCKPVAYEHECPNITGSLDAALALVERKYPRPAIRLDWGACNAAGEMFMAHAAIERCVGEQEFGWTWQRVGEAKAKTPALALLLALLTALSKARPAPPAQTEGEGAPANLYDASAPPFSDR